MSQVACSRTLRRAAAPSRPDIGSLMEILDGSRQTVGVPALDEDGVFSVCEPPGHLSDSRSDDGLAAPCTPSA